MGQSMTAGRGQHGSEWSGKASLGISELRPDVRDEETVQRAGGNLKSK